MEKPMDELTRNATGTTPRRGFFRRIAGAMALGLAGLCARSVARAGRSGTVRRTGLAGAAEGTPSSIGGRVRDQQGRPAGIRPYVPGDKRTADREHRRGDSRRRPAPRRIPARARGRDVAQIQNRGSVQDRRSGDQSARTQESVPAPEGGRAASGRHGDRPAARKRHRVRRLPRRVAVPEQDARRQRRRERGGRG